MHLPCFADGLQLMWREKIRHEAIRPISAIRYLYKHEDVEGWVPKKGTQRLPGREWTSYLRYVICSSWHCPELLCSNLCKAVFIQVPEVQPSEIACMNRLYRVRGQLWGSTNAFIHSNAHRVLGSTATKTTTTNNITRTPSNHVTRVRYSTGSTHGWYVLCHLQQWLCIDSGHP